MQNLIDFLLGTSELMPHGYCFRWDLSLLWLFVGSNTITALSYFSIPLALAFFAYKRKDPHLKSILILFSLFIFSCGLTHVLSIITIWHPVYGLHAVVEAFTAVISLLTAVWLWPLIPKALRIPSPSSLLLANKKLADEILYHKQTKEQLKQLNADLDRLVELKTQALKASEADLKLSQISGGIGCWKVDLINNTQKWSDNCVTLLNLPTHDQPTWDDFIAVVYAEDRQKIIDAVQVHIAAGAKYDVEYRVIAADGAMLWMRSTGQIERDAQGKPIAIYGIVQDINERKAQEVKIKRLSDFYASLSKINHAIVHINNEQDLFTTVCDIAADLEQIKLAWIGVPDMTSKRFIIKARSGKSQTYMTDLVISIDPNTPEGQGPSGRAFRGNRIIASNDFQADTSTAPWHSTPDNLVTWQSSCAIPILLNKQPYAVLTVYTNEINFFDADVLKLMGELSLDMSFALDSYAHEAARKIAEQQLELSGKVFNHSMEAIMITDSNNQIISVNPAFTTITGYSEAEVLNRNPSFIASGIQDKDFYQALWTALLKNNFWQGEIINRHKNGTTYNEWLSISAVRNTDNEIINYISVFTDITEYKEKELQIEHLAHYDALTDLPNRILLKSRLDYELIAAERHKKTFALLFIDLDHFKNINDSLGHSIGDQVLIEIGHRLLACVREEDTVARLGGDEFNILLTDSHVQGAGIIANKIMAALIEPINYQNHQLYLGASIGISLYPDDGDTYETLSQNADTALYQAKNNGRNQYQFFTAAMQEQTKRRMAIENDLRQALARNELKVYFQPQIDTQTEKIIGAEALLRWQHPNWGMVSPAEFIPVAEECGLILTIGDWVLEQSIEQARHWHDAGFNLTIAVNLSLAQFRANTLFEKVRQTLDYYQLPARYLELELTESIAMQSAEMAIEITRQLSQLDIKLSIDDFGTGYSSLNYLQRFSLDKLKIDQSFTRNMTENKDSENIIDTIISLAKILNLKTIAEGVETQQQLDMFKAKQCDEIQGFYFSKAITADEFMALIKGRQRDG